MMTDAYGNYTPGLVPGDPLPATRGTLRHGTGDPTSDIGNVGDAYINTSNGDIYSKKLTGWELQSGVGGAAVNPTGVVDPEGVESGTPGTIYTNTDNHTVWIKETGSGNTGWLQYI